MDATAGNAVGLAAGLVLGASAALVHLGLTRTRIALALRGSGTLALALLPLSVTAAAACLLAASALAPGAAWAALLGFWILRTFALARMGRS